MLFGRNSVMQDIPLCRSKVLHPISLNNDLKTAILSVCALKVCVVLLKYHMQREIQISAGSSHSPTL